MKKTLTVLLLAGLTAISLTACGEERTLEQRIKLKVDCEAAGGVYEEWPSEFGPRSDCDLSTGKVDKK